jgi:hypothetical protein
VRSTFFLSVGIVLTVPHTCFQFSYLETSGNCYAPVKRDSSEYFVSMKLLPQMVVAASMSDRL